MKWAAWGTATVTSSGFSLSLFHSLSLTCFLSASACCMFYACVAGFLRGLGFSLALGELLWIQLIFPHSSFIGHLCGILAGLVYTSGYANQLFDVIELVIADDMLPRAPEYVATLPSGARVLS